MSVDCESTFKPRFQSIFTNTAEQKYILQLLQDVPRRQVDARRVCRQRLHAPPRAGKRISVGSHARRALHHLAKVCFRLVPCKQCPYLYRNAFSSISELFFAWLIIGGILLQKVKPDAEVFGRGHQAVWLLLTLIGIRIIFAIIWGILF